MAALVGYSSSFAVVLAGLRAVGASPAQAASGLSALCAIQGLGMLWLTLRHHTPLSLAWSTPGAALLVSTGAVAGGWPAAVGAFAVVGVLIVLTALWPRLGDLIALIPTRIAQAMLAGVLFPICLGPILALVDHPWQVAPVLAVWALLLVVASRWAVPLAFAAALVVIVVSVLRSGSAPGQWLPQLTWTTPTLTAAAVVGVALPLYVVTMASQNVPGVAVMRSYGYPVPWRETMTLTGAGTIAGAGLGGHAVNLAAITAAMVASPDAAPERDRRWIAAHAAGWAYLVLAVLTTALTAWVTAAPSGVVETVAGLALLSTLGASLAAALALPDGADPVTRSPAVITLLVAAAGVTFLGVGSAFWALIAGLVVHLLLRRTHPGTPSAPSTTPPSGTGHPMPPTQAKSR